MKNMQFLIRSLNKNPCYSNVGKHKIKKNDLFLIILILLLSKIKHAKMTFHYYIDFTLFFVTLSIVYYIYVKLLNEINKIKNYIKEEINIYQNCNDTNIQIIKTFCSDEIKSLKKTNKFQDLKILFDNTVKNLYQEIEKIKLNTEKNQNITLFTEKLCCDKNNNDKVNESLSLDFISNLLKLYVEKKEFEQLNEEIKIIKQCIFNINHEHEQLKTVINNNEYMISYLNNLVLTEIHKIYTIINNNHNYMIDVRQKIHNRLDMSIMTHKSIINLTRKCLFKYLTNANIIYKQIKNFKLDILNNSNLFFDILIIEIQKCKFKCIVNTDINRNDNVGFSLFSGEHLSSPENTIFNSLYKQILYEYQLLIQLYNKSCVQYDIIEYYWNIIDTFNLSQDEKKTILNIKPVEKKLE